MAKSATSKAHQKQLELIYNYLDEDGWDMTAQAPDKENPYHRITADIVAEDDHSQVLWKIELSLMPIPDVNLTDVSILQCFIPLANKFTTLLKPELFEMLAKINAKLPLVGFGFMDEFNLLYYKYNLMLPNDFTDTDGLILSESLSMITYLVSTFIEPILEVATGQKTMANAIAQMPHNNFFS